jgi:hypothetical protein
MRASSSTIAEILSPVKVSSRFFRKDSTFNKEDRSLLKHIHFYKTDDRTGSDFEELNLILEVLDELSEVVEDKFKLCLDRQNRNSRIDCKVRLQGRVLTVICGQGGISAKMANKSMRKIGTFNIMKESLSAIGTQSPGTKPSMAEYSKPNLDLEELEGVSPLEAEYAINLHEHYYSLLDDKSECYFQFVDHMQNYLLLYPSSDDAMLKWSTLFKKQCVNTNLYDCFDIEEMLFHSPAFNVIISLFLDVQLQIKIWRSAI